MPAIMIRRLDATNLEDYRAIRLEALQRAPDAFGTTYALEAARPLEALSARLATSIVFGAYADERIAGMVGLAPNSAPKEEHKAFLWGMYVRTEAQRQGLGSALVAAIIEHAPDAIEQITLSVVQGNQGAQALYARFGFTVYGVEPNALKTPSGYVDEVLMVRFLQRAARRAGFP